MTVQEINEKSKKKTKGSKKVVALSNLPATLPGLQTLVLILALDFYNAPDWACCLVAVLLFFIWAAKLKQIYDQTIVDIFEEKPENE